jgi:hypothetical protein
MFLLQHLRSHAPVEAEAAKKPARAAAVPGEESSSVVFQQLYVSLGSAMVHDEACLLLL